MAVANATCCYHCQPDSGFTGEQEETLRAVLSQFTTALNAAEDSEMAQLLCQRFTAFFDEHVAELEHSDLVAVTSDVHLSSQFPHIKGERNTHTHTHTHTHTKSSNGKGAVLCFGACVPSLFHLHRFACDAPLTQLYFFVFVVECLAAFPCTELADKMDAVRARNVEV